MKRTRLVGTLFAGILVTVTASVDATEYVAYNMDHQIVRNSHSQNTAAETHRRAAGRASGGGLLDIVFVVSNGLLGFVLLRRANHS
jgi:hypothetical protein